MAHSTANETCGCGAGLIDVHAHFLPECYVHALAKAGLKTLDGGMPVPAWSEAAAIEVMDRQGIDTAVISLTSPSTHFLPDNEKPKLVREVNEAGMALTRAHPTRFGFFASLPMPDIKASLAEIDYAVETLGVDGFVLETNINGTYLGSPHFAPVFAELNRRKATLFLHPTSPVCFDQLALGRPAPLLEFPLDTTRTIVDMLYNRVLQTNPDIKVIVPHGGAALTALAARIATFANVPFINPRPASEDEVWETLSKLYYDLAMSTHPVPLAALRALAPISQIMFGSDWPFTPEFGVARNVALLKESKLLSSSEACAVAHDNAARVFPKLMERVRG